MSFLESIHDVEMALSMFNAAGSSVTKMHVCMCMCMCMCVCMCMCMCMCVYMCMCMREVSLLFENLHPFLCSYGLEKLVNKREIASLVV